MSGAKHTLKPVADGRVVVATGDNRLRTYAVFFRGGEAVEVDSQITRRGHNYWRLLWMKGDTKPMGFAAAIAIRAAIAKATGSPA